LSVILKGTGEQVIGSLDLAADKQLQHSAADTRLNRDRKRRANQFCARFRGVPYVEQEQREQGEFPTKKPKIMK
jgi:hypothetical protein